jgi:hypothetical protein
VLKFFGGKGEKKDRPRIGSLKFVLENEEEILPSAGLTPPKPTKGDPSLGKWDGTAEKIPLPAVFFIFRRLPWKSLRKSKN